MKLNQKGAKRVFLLGVLLLALRTEADTPQQTGYDPTKYRVIPRDLPTPQVGYHDRYTALTQTWEETGGQGYYDPTQYRPPQNVPKEANDNKDCLSCHAKLTPSAVKDWAGSRHALNDVGCQDCHGVHPQVEMPLPATCGECHEERVEQHFKGKHGRYGFFGGHYFAGRRGAQYEEMKELGCGTCHNVSLKCDSCHTRHAFRVSEARKPAACGTCHMGPDHGQREYYESSKHGVIEMVEGKIFEEGGRVPGCITCHMSGGSHDVSQGITLGGSSQGKFIGDRPSGDAYHPDPNGIYMNEINAQEFHREREKMVKICKNCHSERFARHKLAAADAVKIATDGLTGEAIRVIQELKKDGLLNPMPEERVENPAPFYPGKEMWLTGHQLYEQTSSIEAKFFHLYKFYNIHAWKGAYHFSPDYVHWYGNSPLKLALSEIWGEANMLRRLSALEERLQVRWRQVSPLPSFFKQVKKPEEIALDPAKMKELAAEGIQKARGE